jgi:arginase
VVCYQDEGVPRSGGLADEAFTVIEVPTALGLRFDGVDGGPAALRSAGLHARLGSGPTVSIEVPSRSQGRGASCGVLNADGIARVAYDLADAVGACLVSCRTPIVLGGDCSLLLGPMLALRRRGRYGLVFMDGHADFQHPKDEEHGEAASLDLALVTGRGPSALTALDGLGPLVQDRDVVLVGLRAYNDNDHFLDEHVGETSMTVIDEAAIHAGGVNHALDAIRSTVLASGLDGFWVHFDVDVLDPELMPAVDHGVPGGLSWLQTHQLLSRVLALPGAVGLEMTIYNPCLDTRGSLARRLADLLIESIVARRRDSGEEPSFGRCSSRRA